MIDYCVLVSAFMLNVVKLFGVEAEGWHPVHLLLWNSASALSFKQAVVEMLLVGDAALLPLAGE